MHIGPRGVGTRPGGSFTQDHAQTGRGVANPHSSLSDQKAQRLADLAIRNTQLLGEARQRQLGFHAQEDLDP